MFACMSPRAKVQGQRRAGLITERCTKDAAREAASRTSDRNSWGEYSSATRAATRAHVECLMPDNHSSSSVMVASSSSTLAPTRSSSKSAKRNESVTTHDMPAIAQYCRAGPTSLAYPCMWKSDARGSARTTSTRPSKPTLIAASKDLHESPTVHHRDSATFRKRRTAMISAATRPTKLSWLAASLPARTRKRPLCQRTLSSANCSATTLSTPMSVQYRYDSSYSSGSSTGSKHRPRKSAMWPCNKSNALRSDATAMKRSFNASVLSTWRDKDHFNAFCTSWLQHGVRTCQLVKRESAASSGLRVE